jgi:hypothetical protein
VVANAGDEAATLQLTDAVLANLTALQLTNVSLFGFKERDGRDPVAVRGGGGSNTTACKVFPGDRDYPSPEVWSIFDLLTGGALIATIPIGAVCYRDHIAYDAAKCRDVLANWTKSETQ